MTSRVSLRVAAADLQPGDRLRPPHPDLVPYHESDQWRVLEPPVKIVLTGDVSVHFGVRDHQRGISLRMPATEQVSVFRDVRT